MTNAKRPGAGDAGPKAEGWRKQTFHPSNGITKAEQGYPASRRKRPSQVSDPAREPLRELIFILTLRAAPGGTGIRAVRSLLKTAARKFRLRCIDARQVGGAR